MVNNIKKYIKESLKNISDNTVVCGGCGWSWDINDSDYSDRYVCHKCGNDNEKKLYESIKHSKIYDIDSDEDYEKLLDGTEKLRDTTTDVSFGAAEVFEVIYDNETLNIIGASWIELSDVFSFHIIIDNRYRNSGYGKTLISSAMSKYHEMVKLRGDKFKVRLNVVNDILVDHLIRNYNLKIISKNKGNFILGN